MAMSFSSIKNFFRGGIADIVETSKIKSIFDDVRQGQVSADNLNPENIHNWVNTRIFGKKMMGPRTVDRGPNRSKGVSWTNDKWVPNTGRMHEAREFAGRNYGKALVGGASVWGINRVDKYAGLLYGGPGYGGYIGYGEGHHSERNALQGARTNMNYQAQMMGLQALSSNQIAPQYSFNIAPMRQRRASAALRNSTEGLAFGLHNGRHGGY